MARYIELDALVAEIDRQIELLKPFLGACAGQIVAEAYDKLSVLEGLKNFLSTLEVKEIGVDLGDLKGDKSAKYIIDTKNIKLKEVDLEKELSYNDYINFFEEHPECDNRDWGYDECWVHAKHFFELGLKAQKGE